MLKTSSIEDKCIKFKTFYALYYQANIDIMCIEARTVIYCSNSCCTQSVLLCWYIIHIINSVNLWACNFYTL